MHSPSCKSEKDDSEAPPLSVDFRSSREAGDRERSVRGSGVWAMRIRNAYPRVNVVCENCRHMMLVNEAVLDLLQEGKS